MQLSTASALLLLETAAAGLVPEASPAKEFLYQSWVARSSFCSNCHPKESLNLPNNVPWIHDYSTSRKALMGTEGPALEWDYRKVWATTYLPHGLGVPSKWLNCTESAASPAQGINRSFGAVTSAVTMPTCSCLKPPLKLPSILEGCTKKFRDLHFKNL